MNDTQEYPIGTAGIDRIAVANVRNGCSGGGYNSFNLNIHNEFAVFTVANWYGTSWKAWISAYEILDKSEYTRSRLFDYERYDTDEFTKEPEEQEIEIWIPVTRK